MLYQVYCLIWISINGQFKLYIYVQENYSNCHGHYIAGHIIDGIIDLIHASTVFRGIIFIL